MQVEDFSQENFEEVTKQFDKVFSQNLERDPEFKISTFVMSMNKLGYLPLSKMIPAQYLLNRESGLFGLNSLYDMTMKLGIKSIQLMEILIQAQRDKPHITSGSLKIPLFYDNQE